METTIEETNSTPRRPVKAKARRKTTSSRLDLDAIDRAHKPLGKTALAQACGQTPILSDDDNENS